jgi:hypothetical protein
MGYLPLGAKRLSTLPINHPRIIRAVCTHSCVLALFGAIRNSAKSALLLPSGCRPPITPFEKLQTQGLAELLSFAALLATDQVPRQGSWGVTVPGLLFVLPRERAGHGARLNLVDQDG